MCEFWLGVSVLPDVSMHRPVRLLTGRVVCLAFHPGKRMLVLADAVREPALMCGTDLIRGPCNP